MVLACDSRLWHIHSTVLCLRSSFFKAAFESNFNVSKMSKRYQGLTLIQGLPEGNTRT